jgi:hypothetical protein
VLLIFLDLARGLDESDREGLTGTWGGEGDEPALMELAVEGKVGDVPADEGRSGDE